MRSMVTAGSWLLFGLLCCYVGDGAAVAQEPPAAEQPPAVGSGGKSSTASTVDTLKQEAHDLEQKVEVEASKLAKVVDADPRAQKISAGLLQPIYDLAEALAIPAFHWIAFALMAAGVVSFAFQLVIGKLVVLARMGFSPREIISDAFGLAISLFGLVLTTQAAAENSDFTKHPASVLSAAGVGIVVGFILYRWGQAQEWEAAAGRSIPAPPKAQPPRK